MVYRRILEWPDKNLKIKSRDSLISSDESIYEDLLDTFKVVGGYGLSAPQIGLRVRVLVINQKLLSGDESLPSSLLMINPEIIFREDDEFFKEACFSLPESQFDILRSRKIKVRWYNRDSSLSEGIFENYSSACVQHEVDHLDGVLTIDKISQLRRSMFTKKYKKKKLLKSRATKSSKEKNKRRKKR